MSPPGLPVPARERARLLRFAAIGAALIVVVTAFVFTKPTPFADHVRLEGVFTSVNGLREDGAVRVGGLDVGRVAAIRPGPGDTSIVAIELDDDSIRPRSDASLTIRPRLVLEGNAYVEIRLGTPTLPPLAQGARVPLSRTSVPVTFDQVLGAFTSPVREAVRGATRELAAGFGDGDDRGLSGARALRRSVRELDGALASVQRVSRAAQGTAPGDLTAAVAGTGDVTSELAADEQALSGIVASYARVSGVLAARDQELGRSMRSFASLLTTAPRHLRTIDRVLPAVNRLGRDLRPALREARPTLRSTRALLTQVSAAVRDPELPRLLRALEPVSDGLATLESRLRRTAPKLQAATDCLGGTIVPALQQKVSDGMHTTGDPAWLDFLHATASLAAASPNFDGNGTTIRLGVTESEQAIQGFMPGYGKLEGGGTVRGMNPEWLGTGVDPVSRPDAVCSQQRLPDLGARASDGPDWLTPARRGEVPADEASRLRTLLRKLTGFASFGDTRLSPAPQRRRPERRRPAARKPSAPTTTTAKPGSPGGGPVAPPAKALGEVLEHLLPTLPGPGDDGRPPEDALRDALGRLLGGQR